MSNTNTNGGRAFAVVMGLAAGAAYGVGGAISQLVKAGGFAVGHIIVAQLLASVIILGVMVLARYRCKVSRKEIIQLVVLGVISAISSYTYYLAIDMISVNQAVAIQFQYVWITVVIQAMLDRKVPNVWVIISAIAIIVGTFFGSGLFDDIISGQTTMNPVGVFFALTCAVCYAIFICFNGHVVVEVPSVTRTFFMAFGALVFVVIMLPLAGPATGNVVDLIPGGIVMGLVMTIIPCICISVATNNLPGGIVGILTSSELPVAVLAGVVLCGESTTVFKILGIVIIIGAIALSELMQGRNKGSAEAEGVAA